MSAVFTGSRVSCGVQGREELEELEELGSWRSWGASSSLSRNVTSDQDPPLLPIGRPRSLRGTDNTAALGARILGPRCSTARALLRREGACREQVPGSRHIVGSGQAVGTLYTVHCTL